MIVKTNGTVYVVTPHGEVQAPGGELLYTFAGWEAAFEFLQAVLNEQEPIFAEQTLLLDFGAGGTTTENGAAPDDPVYYWNNVTEVIGTTSTGQLVNLVEATDNTPTSAGLQMLSRFHTDGANSQGTTNSTAYPVDATRDTLFGNTEAFNGLTNVFPSFKLTELDPGWSYDLTFYASRTGVSDNRETGYTVTGSNGGYVALDPANNVNNTATVLGIVPTADGEITISLAPTASNNSTKHFTYLGVLEVHGYGFV
jgi:hypothetical protein